jgi:hypothetical protein
VDLVDPDSGEQGYECHCKAADWTSPPDLQSCHPPVRCAADECGTSQHESNICIDHYDGTYTCTCAPGWEPTQGIEHGCQGPYFITDPAAFDNKQIFAHNQHVITVTPRSRSLVRCLALENWDGNLTAEEIISGDGFPPYSSASQETLGGVPLVFTLTPLEPATAYAAICATNDGGLSRVYHFVTAEDPCLLGDPCEASQGETNLCDSSLPGTYACLCDGTQWRVANDGKSCESVPVVCQSDECATASDAGNVCYPRDDGTHFCTCAEGWLPTQSTQACVRRALTPCYPDPCSSDANGGNRCYVLGTDKHQCGCAEADGWSVGLLGESCVPPAAPTLAPAEPDVPPSCEHDFCRESESSSNECLALSTDAYKCRCEGYGWTTGYNSLSCKQLPKACQQADHCSALLDARNVCLDRADGSSKPFFLPMLSTL